MIPGMDLLGGADADWDWKATARAWESGFALGIFDGAETFGDAIKAIHEFDKQLALVGKNLRTDVPAIRIHAAWNNHGIIDLPLLVKRCRRYQLLAKEYPQIKIYVSWTCEYSEDTTPKQARERIAVVRTHCPSCIPVQSPMPGGATVRGVVTEWHGHSAQAKANQIVSTDGQNLFDMDARKWIQRNKKALIVFAWGMRFNLSESKEKILPPFKRTAAPNFEYLTGNFWLFREPGPEPIISDALPVVSPRLYKTFAEDMPKENARDNRPMLMDPLHGSKAEIFTLDNQKLGDLPLYPDQNPHQLERYYAGWPGGAKQYGWQLAELSIAKSGSPWGKFRIAGKWIGPVHFAFRKGSEHL